jgi:DTW domain-containing protein
MGGRKYRPRCEGCGLTPSLCACDELPTVSVSTPLAVIQNVREIHKPNNTAKLLRRVLPQVTLLHYGMREPPFDPSSLREVPVQWWVLFPAEDAVPLDEALSAGASGFLMLDGTWHQCSRMRRRVPWVSERPSVRLPDGPPSRWGGRTQHDPRGLSTYEAALRLLQHAEPGADLEALRRAFEVVNARTKFAKGLSSTPDVDATDW